MNSIGCYSSTSKLGLHNCVTGIGLDTRFSLAREDIWPLEQKELQQIVTLEQRKVESVAKRASTYALGQYHSLSNEQIRQIESRLDVPTSTVSFGM